MSNDFIPPSDLEASLAQRHMDTVAYRIGSQVSDHDARIRMLEHDLSDMKDCIRNAKRRMDNHEKDQIAGNTRLLLTVIGIVLSATGGAVLMVFQLMTSGVHT